MSKFQFISGGEVWPDRKTLSLKQLIGISLGSYDRSLMIKDDLGNEFSPHCLEMVENDGKLLVVIHLRPATKGDRTPFIIPAELDVSLSAIARFEDGKMAPMMRSGDIDSSGKPVAYISPL